MRFFDNLKIKAKLLVAFSILIILFLGSSVYSIITISRVNNSYKTLIEGPQAGLTTILKAGRTFARSRRAILTVALFYNNNDRKQKSTTDFKDYLADIRRYFDEYKNIIQKDSSLTDSEKSDRNAWAENILNRINTDYVTFAEKVIAAANREISDSTVDVVDKNIHIPDGINADLDKKTTELDDEVDVITEKVNVESNVAITILFVSMVLLILVAVLIAMIVASRITKSMTAISVKAQEIANGNFDIKIRTNSRDEVGILSNSIADMRDVFQALIGDVNKMAVAFNEGDTDARINPQGFNGGYKVAVDSINNTVSSLIDDTTLCFNYMNEFGRGNFDVDVKVFPGKKYRLTEITNKVKSNLKDISRDLSILIQAAIQGKLDEHVDSAIYEGDWKELIEGLNKLLSVVSEPVKDANDVLLKLAKGDFSVKITKEYYGDFAKMKTSFTVMINTIGSYIKEISEILRAISQGNLRASINSEYVGQFSQIKESINEITSKLNGTLSNIKTSADNVLMGAKQISSGAMLLAEGATEQASSVEQLNASIITINDQTQTNAANTQSANELSSKSMENAQKGNSEMKNMLTSIDGIKDASNNISKIIKVIDDIAFQTNLLALNAAVEAARAGVHGKGFAVVAEEVRSLAARSSQAARETTALIEDSISRVNEGTVLAKTTAEALETIVNDANTISGIINDIYISTTEQAEAISQISLGISQISQVVQSNSSTSEESAAAAQELSSQSEVLNELISYFHL